MSSDLNALSELNPTGRFSDRVADYVKHRPTYPAAAIDAVIAGAGGKSGAAIRAADVGAGTGISSRLLAQRGVEVRAIEPNAEMRAAGASEACPGITWIDGTAEATGLESGSMDLVLCAQAFHWFRAERALAEFARVLRPRGGLALVWNCRDRSDTLTRGYTDAIVAIGGESRVETHRFNPAIVSAAGAPEGAAGLFEPARLATFPHEQQLDLDGLVGRALSASYVPKSGPGHDRLMSELRRLFARHQVEGRVCLRYRTEVYLSNRLR